MRDTNRHLIAFQRISDSNGGNRAAPDGARDTARGYDASVDYVADKLRRAGFTVQTPEFEYDVDVEDAAALTVGDAEYRIDKMAESIDTPVGGVTGPIRVVPEDTDTGCTAADFAGQDFTGSVALIRRGGCTFEIYDGDDSDAAGAGPGPYGSAQIEKTFVDFFADRLDVATEGTDFSGRSDYGAFIAAGIPAAGLFTGAEGIKTEAQAAKWGGTAGIAYDPCYHQVCDNLGNVDREAIDRNLDAMAWAVGVYAYSTEEINGVPPRAQRLKVRSQAKNKMKVARNYVPSDKAA